MHPRPSPFRRPHPHRRTGARSRAAWRGTLVAACGAVAIVAGGLVAAGEARAVVTAGEVSPSQPLPAALAAAGWPAPRLDGLARLANGCSAVLLHGGRALLGAAHCAAPAGSTAVLASGESVVVTAAVTAPGWAGTAGVHDLAVMTLATPARTDGYRIATLDEVEAAGAVLVAGWGGAGTPAAPQPAGPLRFGFNEYDGPYWPPGHAVPADGPRIRLFDFDDGSFGANTLGLAPGGHSSLGFGPHEAMLAGSDSGGPSLVPVTVPASPWRRWLGSEPEREWRIAAIHVGIDGRRGGGFGGVGLDLLVAPYGDWIVRALAGAGARAP